jgi:bifunctional DNase/RNase
MENMDNQIPVKVEQVYLSNMGFVVMLKSMNDDRSLPIFIGAAEAQAIALQINNVEVPRPLTHDLLKNVIEILDGDLLRVEVCNITDGTFFARLVIDRDEEEVMVDSRPSDAVALALRFDVPILVAEVVMDEAGRPSEEMGGDETGRLIGKTGKMSTAIAKIPEKRDKALSPVEKLKRDLTQAVTDERYEDAARIRDEINRLEHTHTEN